MIPLPTMLRYGVHHTHARHTWYVSIVVSGSSSSASSTRPSPPSDSRKIARIASCLSSLPTYSKASVRSGSHVRRCTSDTSHIPCDWSRTVQFIQFRRKGTWCHLCTIPAGAEDQAVAWVESLRAKNPRKLYRIVSA